MEVLYALFSTFLVLVAGIVATFSHHSYTRSRLSKVLYWRAKRTRSWVLVFLYEVCVAVVMGWASETLKQHTLAKGETFWIPDIQPPYSPEDLHDLMRGYGAEGRHMYARIELFDIFVYGQGYALLLSSALQWASGEDGTITPLSMIAWHAWVADQVENAAQLYCVLSFDEEGPDAVWKAVAYVGTIFNVSKWAMVAFGVVSFVRLAVQQRGGQKTKSD